MQICILVGSNRKNGLSRQVCNLIEQYMKGKAQCKFIYLAEKYIEFCDADNQCTNQICQLKDDVGYIVNEMQRADCIIYMPVMHAYGTNSRFQAFLERAGYGFLRAQGRPLKDKVAAVVVVGRRYGHTAVYSQVVLNIMLNKMILAGSGFPAAFMGMLGAACEDVEAIEALHDTLDRMLTISHRLSVSSLSDIAVYA